jgi:hypothetical protein
MKGVQTPSKFLSLNFLKKLQNNKYISENTCEGSFKEYCKEEVNKLYFEKADKQAIEMLKQTDKAQRFNLKLKNSEGEIVSKIKLLTKKQSEKNDRKWIKELNSIYGLSGVFSKKECWEAANKFNVIDENFEKNLEREYGNEKN